MTIIDNKNPDNMAYEQERCAYCGHLREDHKLEQIKRGQLSRSECEIDECDCLKFATSYEMGVQINENKISDHIFKKPKHF